MGAIDLARVADFARAAHGDQIRKYTGEPYIEHPLEVAEIVRSVTNDLDVIAAAILHDVAEDTAFTLEQIRANFGPRVAAFVAEVTDVSRPQDGNRAKRKAMDREHLAKASPQGQTIKLADLISNADSILRYDPDFAKVYIREKRALLEVRTMGNHVLYDRAMKIVEQAEKDLAA
jgi:(p)ppGpp synthase/HD superfamily hydrolase